MQSLNEIYRILLEKKSKSYKYLICLNRVNLRQLSELTFWSRSTNNLLIMSVNNKLLKTELVQPSISEWCEYLFLQCTSAPYQNVFS